MNNPFHTTYTALHHRVNAALQRQRITEEHYDVIVLGVGSMGASTCYHLAKQGLKVLGLEQFNLPHELGAHAGQSRIIRKAYAEHPDYVPLLQRAYENWKELEAASGEQVYFKTGLLYAGLPTDPFIKGVQRSSELYNIPISRLSVEECRKAFPQFSLPANYQCLLEPDAGFITPERSILLYAEQALQLGANIRTHEKVLDWKLDHGIVTVSTETGTYTANKLVITAGPWAAKMIPSLANQLTVTRQTLAWVQPPKEEPFSLGQLPCWFIEDGGNEWYGFPQLPAETFGHPQGMKLALHSPLGPATHPDTVNRNPLPEEEEKLLGALRRFLPEAYHNNLTLKTCLYTNSPDQHFILDLLPKCNNQVSFAAGFSGHGFKFVSVMGEIMADLAVKGKTNLPIEFLSWERLKE